MTLRIADRVAGGTTAIGDLAAACGADAESLHRMLRHLVAQGVFAEPEPGRIALNDAAQLLVGPSAHAGYDLHGIGGRMAHAWGTLLTVVKTGAPAYHEVFGRPFWEDLDANPAIAASFDALMGPAGHGTPDPDVLLTGDWQSVATVVDVGGGTGALLAEVLRAQPHVRGILVDLPRAVARAGDLLAAAGVADRATTIAQSFFDPLPPGGDVYMLKNVLADWPDAGARAILERCAGAARPRGRVVVLGGVTDAGTASPELLMLVLVGGTGRTLAEFAALAQQAGLEVIASGRTASGRFVVECRPAGVG